MGDCHQVLYGWSWEENKKFEIGLAVVDEKDPDRWKVVAAMVGGDKSAEEVQKHYVILLEDLKCIESGDLDHALCGELAQPFLRFDCIDSVFLTDHLKLLDRMDHHLAISSNQEPFAFPYL